MGAQSLSLGSWWEQHKRAVSRIGVGHLVYGTFNWLYDHILYVFVVYRLGLFFGGSLMTLGSLLQCAALLLAYQRLRIEWVGAGAIHSLESNEATTLAGRVIAWALRKGRIPIFFTLCIFQDPFITTAYFKKGQFEPLTPKDWQIFCACVLVSNGYWTLRAGLIAQALVWTWRHAGGLR